MNDENEEIPDDCERIWSAKVHLEIVRIKYKTKYKEKFSFNGVYKENSELDKNSYFMKNIRVILKFDKEDEEFIITKIEKLKYLGFSVPPIK